MSDPVTNVEIEDVLSSIRRLVSDGDKARTRDPAPAEPVEDAHEAPVDDQHVEAESEPDVRPPSTDKFVLTPAFLVVDRDTPAQPDEDEQDDHAEAPHEESAEQHDAHYDHHGDEQSDHADDTAENDTHHHDAPAEPLTLTDPVEDQDTSSEAADDEATSDLVATIAELEAAFGNDETGEYEPDGSEIATAETIAWPGAMVTNLHDVEDAQVEDEPSDQDSDDTASVPEEAAADEAASDGTLNDETVDTPQDDQGKTDAHSNAPNDDTFDDDDLDGLLDAGGVQLDEAALRELVAEVVREELTGPLGERITRNVRKLVRREIYRILSSQEFD